MSDDNYGPILPPKLKETYSNEVKIILEEKSIGPKIPSNFREVLKVEESSSDELGPSLESYKKDYQNEDADFKKFLRMKEKEEDQIFNKREEWMITLPNKQKTLNPQSFKKRNFDTGHFIDESWTDTPGKKRIKSKNDSVIKRQNIDILEKHYSEKQKLISEIKLKPLIEIHKDLKKHKELKENQISDKKKERVPFDRETDMKIKEISNLTQKSNYKTLLGQDNSLSNKFSKSKNS
ncbi:GPALPP motifs-containing protein 1-like isoform X2 [Gordionus sp. m RMFG-2023]|uniref:GPALPP motifs-containing protein 1-like isoform X2 n=1 Tax=Gordionus sp. m RMFG-2023 TaxID=3053472 RepID=UPI0031FD5EA3